MLVQCTFNSDGKLSIYPSTVSAHLYRSLYITLLMSLCHTRSFQIILHHDWAWTIICYLWLVETFLDKPSYISTNFVRSIEVARMTLKSNLFHDMRKTLIRFTLNDVIWFMRCLELAVIACNCLKWYKTVWKNILDGFQIWLVQK